MVQELVVERERRGKRRRSVMALDGRIGDSKGVNEG